jgi:hypothetical protein
MKRILGFKIHYGGQFLDPHSLYADPDSAFLTNVDPDLIISKLKVSKFIPE